MQTECSGLFELRLKSFRNDLGKESLGGCCTERSTQNGTCIGTCKTRFRVCLKHYQAKIDTTSPCTFGDVVTPVLGDNSFNLTQSQYNSQQSDSSIRFPFDFTWPVSDRSGLRVAHSLFTSTSRRRNRFGAYTHTQGLTKGLSVCACVSKQCW